LVSEIYVARSQFPDSLKLNFFIVFVDGIFTTFIACLFTNTSDAIRENRTMSCVLHACHAD